MNCNKKLLHIVGYYLNVIIRKREPTHCVINSTIFKTNIAAVNNRYTVYVIRLASRRLLLRIFKIIGQLDNFLFALNDVRID